MSNQDPLFVPASFFLVRIPSYPIDFTKELFNSTNLKEFVKEFYDKNDSFKEAILIASEALTHSVKQGRFNEDVLVSLIKYLIRMSSRPTPFGLFSFVSVGHVGENRFEQLDIRKTVKRARPDMEWLQQVISMIVSSPDLELELLIQRNHLLWKKENRYGLCFLRTKENQSSVTIQSSLLVEAIFELTQQPISIRELIIELISQKSEREFEKLKQVIFKLINQEFLEYSIQPSLMSLKPFENFIKKVPVAFLKQLENIASLLENYSSNLISDNSMLNTIKSEMESVVKSDSYLQVDSANPYFSPILPRSLVEEVASSAEVLWKMTSQNDLIGLEGYKNQFISKYGFDRLVPLLELLDDTKGLGVPNWFKTSDDKKNNNHHKKKLCEILCNCLIEGKKEIEITDELVVEWKTYVPYHKAPPSMDLYFEIVAASLDEIHKGNYEVVLTNQSWQGGSTFNRFLDLFEQDDRKNLQAFFRKEEELDPTSVFVETSYLPKNTRAQNVAIHPSPRKMVLNFSPGGENSIKLFDLYVGANQDGLYITSEQGDVEYYFTATNVLNPIFAPMPMRFIKDVSKSKYHMCSLWNWDELSDLPYLPRVRYKKIILSPAQWKVLLSGIRGSKKDSIHTLRLKFLKWATKYDVPRYVFITEADQKLLIDRECSELVDILLSYLRKNTVVILTEKVGGPAGEWIEGSQFRYSAEFVLPLLKNPIYQLPTTKKNPVRYISIPHHERWKLPGSDWLYIKLFMPYDLQERFIAHHLLAFANGLIQKNNVKKWFYVRYVDDEKHHLRVRFHIANTEINDIINDLYMWSSRLMDQGILQEIVLASYEREIERYGGPAVIDYIENIFCADSQTSAAILHCKKSLSLPMHVIGALSILRMFNDLALTDEEIQLFFKEFPTEKSYLEGYREWKKTFENPLPLSLEEALQIRSGIYKNCWQEVNQLILNGHPLSTSRFSIINSLIHMHCIRVFGVTPKTENQTRAYVHHSILKKVCLQSYESEEQKSISK